jgi:hypothetical protein
MLSVPCGLVRYLGPWPPVGPSAALIEPLADLAACTPHAGVVESRAADDDGRDVPLPEPATPGRCRAGVRSLRPALVCAGLRVVSRVGGAAAGGGPAPSLHGNNFFVNGRNEPAKTR